MGNLENINRDEDIFRIEQKIYALESMIPDEKCKRKKTIKKAEKRYAYTLYEVNGEMQLEYVGIIHRENKNTIELEKFNALDLMLIGFFTKTGNIERIDRHRCHIYLDLESLKQAIGPLIKKIFRK